MAHAGSTITASIDSANDYVQIWDDSVQEYRDATVAAFSAAASGEVAQFVALDTPVTLDNVRIEARLTGGQGFRVGSVAGTFTYNVSAICSFATDSVFGSNRAGLTATTTMTHPFAWVGQTDADHITGMLYDRGAGRMYSFEVMTNTGPTLSFVRIKRLA